MLTGPEQAALDINPDAPWEGAGSVRHPLLRFSGVDKMAIPLEAVAVFSPEMRISSHYSLVPCAVKTFAAHVQTAELLLDGAP